MLAEVESRVLHDLGRPCEENVALAQPDLGSGDLRYPEVIEHLAAPGDHRDGLGAVVGDVPAQEEVGVIPEVAAVVDVGGADEQAVLGEQVEQPREFGPRIREVLDDLAGDDQVEPFLRALADVDEVLIDAQVDHIAHDDALDRGQLADVLVVQAAADTEHHDAQAVAAEDVSAHLAHVELASGPLLGAHPRRVPELVHRRELRVVDGVVEVRDV